MENRKINILWYYYSIEVTNLHYQLRYFILNTYNFIIKFLDLEEFKIPNFEEKMLAFIQICANLLLIK